MATARKRFINVDVVDFLENIMRNNTEHYQSDFELDKETIFKSATSKREEDKALLWLSRACGTQCNKLHDVFVKNSAAHTTWCYYGAQGYDNNSIVACAVEINGVVNGVVRGNVYELDFSDLIKDIHANAVAPLEYEKTFEDGFVVRVPFEKSNTSFYYDLVEEHGAIVDSLAIPQDAAELRQVLAAQKSKRGRLRIGFHNKDMKPALDEQVKSAATRVEKPSAAMKKQEIER